jgi:hypothetical protein
MTATKTNEYKTNLINSKPKGNESHSFVLTAKSLLTNSWLHVAILIALVASCAARTLGSYFLADDIGEIAYVARIFHGHRDLFWLNFTGNYMQIGSMSVYRPFLLISLVVDYLLWGANAFGYYLTNLLYYTGDVLLFYLLVKQLTNSWGKANQNACAFFAAALFAVSPLHLESISWVVGRVDIISCFYYLLSFLLAIKGAEKQNKILTASAIGMFFLALFTKEMAIGLPVMLSATAFFLPKVINTKVLEPCTLKQRASLALNFSFPFWLATAFYFVLRFITLGTITGGYVGSIGASQFANIYSRWLDPDTLSRLVLPFNYFVFHGPNIYANILLACYAVMVIIFCHRLFKDEVDYNFAALILVFLVTCAAPIYQLWGLGYNLEGSRFYFFLTLPLSLVLPLVLFQPSARSQTSNFWPLALGVVALMTVVAVFEKTAYANNTVWLKAGKVVRALHDQSETLAANTTSNKDLLILGLPKEIGGAHMIENGDTYLLLLQPPFSKTNVSDRFLTFDPIVFGPSQFINSGRFKETIANKNVLGPFLFGEKQMDFQKITLAEANNSIGTAYDLLSPSSNIQPYQLGHVLLTGRAQAQPASPSSGKPLLQLQQVQAGDGLRLSGLNINPCDYDYLEGELVTDNADKEKEIAASWNLEDDRNHDNQASSPIISQSQAGIYHFSIHLAHNWHWFAGGNIHSLFLQFFPCKRLIVANLQLVQTKEVAPHLAIEGGKQVNTGVYVFAGTHPSLSVKPLKGSSALEIQISKPNCFFENLSGKEEMLIGKTMITPVGNSAAVVATLKASDITQPGFYQIRTRCLNKNGAALGEFSEIETIQITH